MKEQPKIFISYSWNDKEIVDQIDEDLKLIGLTLIRDVREAEAAQRALKHLQEALEIVGDNVFIYAGMAETYFILSHTKGKELGRYINKVEECAKKKI